MVVSSTASTNSLLIRRLYRSLIKASRPFDDRSSNRGSVLTCLIHRTGAEDVKWHEFLRGAREPDDDLVVDSNNNNNDSTAATALPNHQLFCKLLRELVSGHGSSGLRQMRFPSHDEDDDHDATVDDSSSRRGGRMANLIRREFRCPESSDLNEDERSDSDATRKDHPAAAAQSRLYSVQTRREVAFMALRELNKKLDWASRLEALDPHEHQAARFVSPLPLHPPSAYLQPGTFLISHPHMTDYFRRTVICLLHHQDEEDSSSSSEAQSSSRSTSPYHGTTFPSASGGGYGTYGLIVNRTCVSPESGRNLRLQDIVQPLPSDMAAAFGLSAVREGGPVHMALQMMHSSPATTATSSATAAAPQEVSNNPVGGTLLPMASAPDAMMAPNGDDGDDIASAAECISTALHSDRGVYYRGDLAKASDAVMNGLIDREDVSFFVGASCWSPGQLESEIERGFWLPCRGPPDICLTGICEHDEPPTVKGQPRPKADLWLSMLSACGEKEAELAHLMWSDDGEDECGGPCDAFS